MERKSFERPEWEPVPHTGCRGVDHKVLMARPGMALALLRFSEGATIHEHSAAWPIDAFCLEGHGMVSVGVDVAPFSPGQRVLWPAGVNHRLWTEDSAMVTLMVEHPPR